MIALRTYMSLNVLSVMLYLEQTEPSKTLKLGGALIFVSMRGTVYKYNTWLLHCSTDTLPKSSTIIPPFYLMANDLQ